MPRCLCCDEDDRYPHSNDCLNRENKGNIPSVKVVKNNRYIYHYCAVNEGNIASVSGIAQLAFRIVSQDDLEKLKALITDGKYDFIAHSITSLSYLGREQENLK